MKLFIVSTILIVCWYFVGVQSTSSYLKHVLQKRGLEDSDSAAAREKRFFGQGGLFGSLMPGANNQMSQATSGSYGVPLSYGAGDMRSSGSSKYLAGGDGSYGRK